MRLLFTGKYQQRSYPYARKAAFNPLKNKVS